MKSKVTLERINFYLFLVMEVHTLICLNARLWLSLHGKKKISLTSRPCDICESVKITL